MVITQSELMTKAQALMKQKDDLEAEIKTLQDNLKAQKVGMSERLVDSSGFPRSDIDLVVVTTARSGIIKLQNDLKSVMLQIEEALHAVHAEAIAEKQRKEQEKKLQAQSSPESASTSASASTTTGASGSEALEVLKPFAKVNMVAPDSPAREAGLLQHDRIVSFGTVTERTPDTFAALSKHVMERENKPILVKLLRGDSTNLVSVILVPSQGWGGRGLLGCHIVPA
ncbi:26S proteasome regulatory subunit N4 [Entomortierella parvispora]|uniref:Probable 26S proteasome regulatory subunit p27 n=1 Tax=Entomortierella parvispora TaxID=205924 RepID=A0A9P3M116_9FUNG|nr:26S proteasome regulatory subunit N4 [Entomortierella parvispora]